MTQDDGEAEFNSWLGRAQRELVPMMRDSACCVSFSPDTAELDVQYAMELGLMILMDKPVIVIAAPGEAVPEKLRLIADKILYVNDPRSPGAKKQLELAMLEVAGPEDDDDDEG